MITATPYRSDPSWIQFTPPWECQIEESSTRATGNAEKKVTIVIADDDPVSRTLLATTVRNWGLSTIMTKDGHEAMAAIRAAEGPVVAILDWMMPVMDGVQVCKRVRQGDKPVYIILLTTRAAKESLVEGLQSGADDYLVKPFDKNELLARVNVGIRIINLQCALTNQVKELEQALREVEHLRNQISVPL